MARKKHDEPVVSRHLEIFASDWEFLQAQFGRDSDTRLGTSHAIRKMIRKGVRDYQERLLRRAERVAPLHGGGGAGVQLDMFFVPVAKEPQE